MCVFDEWVIRNWWTKSHRVLSCPLTRQFCIFILKLIKLHNFTTKLFWLCKTFCSWCYIYVNSVHVLHNNEMSFYILSNFSAIKFPRLYNHFKLTLSVLNILAISGTSGSSGFGSHKREQMDSNTKNKKK